MNCHGIVLRFILLAPLVIVASCSPSSDTPRGFATSPLTAEEAGSPVRGDWLVPGLDSEPAHLNPLMGTTGAVGVYISSLIFEKLLKLNKDTLEPEPHIAKSFEISDDHLVYTFHLRDDVKFSDGVPLTTADLKFSYEAIMNPKNDTADVRNYLQDIERLEIIDDYTIRYHMKKPYFRHLIIFASTETAILPKHIYEKGDFTTHPANRAPIGSGPYKFVSWDTGTQITLDRNELYWGQDAGYVEKILFKIITDDNAAFQVLDRGEIDLYRLNSEIWTHQASTPDFESRHHKITPFSPYPGSVGTYGWMGWNARKPMFSDKRVRRAMTMLLDRQLILETIYYGIGVVPSGDAFIESPEYNKDIKPWPFDPEQAGKLLDEAGWRDTDGDGVRDKNGVSFHFEFSYTSGVPAYDQLTTVYQEELERAGIKMDLRPLEWATFQERVHKHNFDACMMAWVLDVGPDPYQLWHSSQAESGSNFCAFINEEADRIMDEMRLEFDHEKRIQLYHRFHEILHEEQPYTFLLSRKQLYAVNNRFQDVKNHPLGFDHLEWWVPKDRQKYTN